MHELIHPLTHNRRAQRRAVDIPCELIARSCDEPINHRASDMTPHGVWVDTSFPLDEGAQVVVSFRPPRATVPGEMTLFARVARSIRPRHTGGFRPRAGMALEFVGVSVTDRKTLRAALRGLPAAPPKRRQLAKLDLSRLPRPSGRQMSGPRW
ncbi:MAG: PilZ domain-containing protein [Deltaproteobacteria bacterium]|nr:PilZ domain-containing protein [Deltaproteobacteria bacterium]